LKLNIKEMLIDAGYEQCKQQTLSVEIHTPQIKSHLYTCDFVSVEVH
jgi:hypothetical protein